jgi:glucodextranase-like protein
MLRWFSLALLILLTVASLTTPAGTIGTTGMAPNSTSAGVPVTVTVTSSITDPSLIPASVNLQRLDSSGRVVSVIGILHDDGLNGDAVAGDNVYTITTTVFENTPGTVNFRVSAGFKGSLLRSFSPLLPFQINGTPAGIAIVSPSNAAYLNLSPVTVNGTVGDANSQVTINGVTAPVSGNTFVASVPLNEGPNTLTAVASNSNGTTSTANIVVTLDTTPPHVAIYSPVDGSVTSDAATTVTGLVNDIVVGTVNPQQATVTVNGVAAQVLNRTFTALSIPLAIGPNTVTAQAVDRAGNAALATITITRQALTQPTLRIFSGNGQRGVIRTPLVVPLVAQLVNGAGQPVAGVPVVFQVTNQDGTLLPVGGTGGGGAGVVVNTDAQGLASANFTLGSRVGAGNNVITASTAGLATTAVFAASATPSATGLIVIDSGNDQSGVIGQGLPLPFIAVVTDIGFNRLGGVPVTFTIKKGGGNFAGKNTLSTISDSDGRVMATLTLGPNPGINNNLVEANFVGNTGFPSTFSATGLAPGPANLTSISGVVLDNSDNAIPGVTMRLFQVNQGNNGNVPQQVAAPVQTDVLGHFTIKPAPVGVFKLMADGGTAQRPGSWPTLEYDIVPVSGQDNTVGLPIYLPQLDTSSQFCISPVKGGTLTLPRVPGFSLTIAPGSATFPGGSKTGCVSVTPVNIDKVPMSPGFGQQPRFVVTIQPVGTTFNPPAPMTIPNVDGLAPRAVTEMYSYDHDLATFVAIGSATVSDDGSVIRSDAGVGVLKAGWNCGGNPNSSGSTGGLTVSISPQKDLKAPNKQFTATANGAPAQDGTYRWELISTQTEDDPSIAQLLSAPSCDDQSTCTATFVGLKGGKVTLRVHHICKITGAEVTADERITVLTVQFQDQNGAPLPSPFRVGITANGHDRTQHLQAIVTPADEVKNVTLAGSSNIGVVNVAPSGNAIKFDLFGLIPSPPAPSPRGDQSIVATHSSGITVPQSVSVVVPAQVAQPHETFSGPVTPINLLGSAGSSPAIIDVPPGSVALVTVYGKFLSVIVKDQFGDLIGDIYLGASVFETSLRFPINQSIRSDSTYLDPVVVFEELNPGSVVPANSAAALTWPQQPPVLLTPETIPQNISVDVDGFVLNPGIVNRQITSIPPSTITITWP